MQTAAVAAPASVAPASASVAATTHTQSPFASPEPSSERIPPYWDAARQAWVGTPTDEEKFVALKALFDESRAEYEAGLGIELSAEELGPFIDVLSERAGQRVRARRAAQKLAHAS